MRALVVHDWTTFEELSIEDDWPVPPTVPGTIRIRTQAAGANFALSLRVQGKYQIKPPLPHVPGNEVAGFVTEVGADVIGFAVGDRVTAFVDYGAYADECIAPAHRVFRIPDDMPFVSAVGLTTSCMSAYIALVWPQWFDLRFGQTILIHGAAGGVGLPAIDIAKVLGATVIATCGSADKVRACQDHGADHVVNYREREFRKVVLEVTDGRGVDAVFDPVGGDVFNESLRCMAPEGAIMPVGFSSGVVPQIPANILLVKNIRVLGFNNGYYNGQWGSDPKRHQDMGKRFEPQLRSAMSQMFRWIAQGRMRLHTGGVFALSDRNQAMRMVLERKAIGRVAVAFDGEARRLGLAS